MSLPHWKEKKVAVFFFILGNVATFLINCYTDNKELAKHMLCREPSMFSPLEKKKLTTYKQKTGLLFCSNH